MARKQGDWSDDARKYAGKNRAEIIHQGNRVPGMGTIRPHIVHPGGRTFADQWVIPSDIQDTGKGHQPVSGKKK